MDKSNKHFIFPTQYSTLSSTALKWELEKKYGLQITNCRLLIRNVSDVYIVEGTNDRYIFKIYRNNHRTTEEVNGEVALLNVLYESGARVACPIADQEGNYIQAFQAAEGVRNGVMYSYAKGNVVYNMDKYQLLTVSNELAVVHNITENLEIPYRRKPYTLETMIEKPLRELSPAFINLEREYDWLSKIGQDVLTKLNTFDFKSFAAGYCHYDMLPKNFHFDSSGQITFFDFDFAGYGFLVNDIVSFYIHYFLEVDNKKISKKGGYESFEIFLNRYKELRSLSGAELEVMPSLGFAWWLFYLDFQYKSYDDWSNFFFNENFIRGRIELIKRWMLYSGY